MGDNLDRLYEAKAEAEAVRIAASVTTEREADLLIHYGKDLAAVRAGEIAKARLHFIRGVGP
jgi:hypothetical protein